MTSLPTWLPSPTRRPLVMGILNVTPDSFSEGSRFALPEAALAHGEKLCADGADWIDVGGESTRPGSQRVDAAEQLRRLMPVMGELRKRTKVILSIDTTLADVAEAALDAGFDLINDISAGRDDARMFELAASRRTPLILMHMQGQPATMQADPRYQDVVEEVRAFLIERMDAACLAGVAPGNILLDPGIGFGKTLRHNLALLRDVGRLKELGRPLVVGTSRKGFLGKITGESADSGRPFGTAASVAWALAQGASAVRVHDVAAMAQVTRMVRAIETGGLELPA